MRQAIKERMRGLRADLEAIDSDGEDEPWARKPIADRLALEACRACDFGSFDIDVCALTVHPLQRVALLLPGYGQSKRSQAWEPLDHFGESCSLSKLILCAATDPSCGGGSGLRRRPRTRLTASRKRGSWLLRGRSSPKVRSSSAWTQGTLTANHQASFAIVCGIPKP